MQENKLINNSLVEIGGEIYRFSNNINENKEFLNAFNNLAKLSFGISFRGVGGEYEPHVLIEGNKVCANVSVNKVLFNHMGKRKLYIQLGTIMTDKEYRNKGLSRWLIESIVSKWKDNCDAIYLFANDSVLDFYPKFGFVKEKEYEYILQNVNECKVKPKKLDMSEERHINLVLEKYKEQNPFSKLCMIENQAIFSFYYDGLMKNNVYYIEEFNVIVFAQYQKDKLLCYDIFGNTNEKLVDILRVMCIEETNEVSLGFTPKDITGLKEKEYHEEDTTLFIHSSLENIFATSKLMFPIMSHA